MSIKKEHKSWAQHLQHAIPGGKIAVHRHWDETKTNGIDIFTSQDDEGIVAATIGLMDVNQGQDSSQSIFTEILLDARGGDARVANIVSTAGFFVLKDGWRLAPGVVFEDIVKMYLPHAEVRHLLFVPPFQWDRTKMSAVNLGVLTVHPLLAVPITEGELQYVRTTNAAALQALWERSGCDVLDLGRRGAA